MDASSSHSLISRLLRTLDPNLEPLVGFDKVKSIESKVLRGVERSTVAAAQEEYDLAIQEAREAMRQLDALKAIMSKEQRQAETDDDDDLGSEGDMPPMTKGPNIFDLSIMVKCNLAAQLRNTGRLDESLDLYTQLCKMAMDQPDGSSSLVSDSNGHKQQQQSKYLLSKFGLDIGNILYESGEYQRALKYYRLTLDRLSSHSGNRHLRIKLMNNITTTLMTMNGLVGTVESLSSSKSKRTNDHVTSLQLLLNDNSLEVQNQQIVGQTLTTGNPQFGTKQALSDCKHPLNSHHHKFGLNLIACQYEGSDISAMYSTLKSLVKVDVCHQYRRVFKFGTPKANGKHDDRTPGFCEPSHLRERSTRREPPPPAHTTSSLPTQGRTLPSESGRSPISDVQLASARSNASNVSPSSLFVDGMGASDRFSNKDHDDEYPAQVQTNSDIGRAELVMRAMETDKLEEMVHKKEDEIRRALIVSCNMMIGLGRRTQHRRQRQHAQEQGRASSLKVRSSSSAKINNSKPDEDDIVKAGTKHVDSGSNRTTARTSVLAQCVKLLLTSDLYKGLVADLRMSNTLQLLSREGQLSRALRDLAEIDPYQQVSSTSRNLAAVSGSGSSTAKALMSASMDRVRAQASSSEPIFVRSTQMATNFGLIYLLRNRVDFSLDLCTKALAMSSEPNVDALINTANCYLRMDQSQRAESYLAGAFKVNRDSWPINYNRLLLNTRLGRHFDDLDIATTKIITDQVRGYAGSRARGKMVLAQVQSLLLYHQSNMRRDLNHCLTSLLDAANTSPEISLMATKLIDNNLDQEKTKSSPIAILNRTLRVHPYHLPTAERLIALLIDKFDYQEARSVLLECIRNRPDQVKWYQMYAECHRRAANYNEAIASYKYIIDTFPFDISSVRALGKLAEELGLSGELEACKAKLQQLSTDS